MSQDELLKTSTVADELLVPEKTLAQWRYLGRGPRFLKLGGHVRYRRADLDAWIAECAQGGDAA